MKDTQNLSKPIFQIRSSFKSHSYSKINPHNSSTLRLLKPAMLLLILIYLSFSSAQNLSNYKPINTPTTSIVMIPHIKYGQGLNRWSFLSVDRSNHGLLTSLLCPNPMLSTTSTKEQPPTHQPSQKLPHQISPLLPTEIWAIKTKETKSFLPCSLRQNPPKSPHHRHYSSPLPFTENRILLINISFAPFNYYGATPCSKYIKLKNDPQEEGALLRCRDIPYDSTGYSITWPTTSSPNWSLLENLESFLKTERLFRRQFYFQIYFKSFIGSNNTRCTVQQYELDLSYPEGSSRYCNLTNTAGNYNSELCGEFNCDELIFPLYPDPQEPENKAEVFEEEEENDYDYFDEEEHDAHVLPEIPIVSDGARITGSKDIMKILVLLILYFNLLINGS